ncbi:hypothetical protein KIL84_008046 [Mauremys mutica]|uniref:Uncharacterized protein n=1 Tax=Mauremys mutica TaxID=74926 RepID=A0A9D3X490_9SAUR|nr:hypothetical protein KIL84_008046 [Mauremys mutica]
MTTPAVQAVLFPDLAICLLQRKPLWFVIRAGRKHESFARLLGGDDGSDNTEASKRGRPCLTPPAWRCMNASYITVPHTISKNRLGFFKVTLTGFSQPIKGI